MQHRSRLPCQLLLRFLTLALVYGFVPALSAQETPRDANTLAVGDKVSGPIRYGRRVIAIPAGQWRVFAKSERSITDQNSDPRMLSLWLDEVVEKRLNRTLEIAASNYSNNLEWFADPCKSKDDSYLITDEKIGLNNQFCTRVGFKNNMVAGASGEEFEVWARDLIRSGISYSKEMPFVKVTRFTRSDYLHMTMSFDPKVSGIGDSARSERTLNDWNARSEPASKRHVRFYEALASWAPTFAKATRRAFDGDKSLTAIDFGAPSLPRE